MGALRPEAVAREHLTKSINDTWVLASGSIDYDGNGVADAAKRIVRDVRGRLTELDDGLVGGSIIYKEYNDTEFSELQFVLMRGEMGR